MGYLCKQVKHFIQIHFEKFKYVETFVGFRIPRVIKKYLYKQK